MTKVLLHYSDEAIKNYFIATGSTIDKNLSVELDFTALDENRRNYFVFNSQLNSKGEYYFNLELRTVNDDLIASIIEALDHQRNFLISLYEDDVEKFVSGSSFRIGNNYVDDGFIKKLKALYYFDIDAISKRKDEIDKEEKTKREIEKTKEAEREANFNKLRAEREAKRIAEEAKQEGIEEEARKLRALWIEQKGSKYLNDLKKEGFDYYQQFNKEYASSIDFEVFDEEYEVFEGQLSEEQLNKYMEIKNKFVEANNVFVAECNDDEEDLYLVIDLPILTKLIAIQL